jgi:hypothetical protein
VVELVPWGGEVASPSVDGYTEVPLVVVGLAIPQVAGWQTAKQRAETAHLGYLGVGSEASQSHLVCHSNSTDWSL